MGKLKEIVINRKPKQDRKFKVKLPVKFQYSNVHIKEGIVQEDGSFLVTPAYDYENYKKTITMDNNLMSDDRLTLLFLTIEDIKRSTEKLNRSIVGEYWDIIKVYEDRFEYEEIS